MRCCAGATFGSTYPFCATATAKLVAPSATRDFRRSTPFAAFFFFVTRFSFAGGGGEIEAPFCVRRSRTKIKRCFAVFGIRSDLVRARSDIRRRLNETTIDACLYSSPFAFFSFCFDIRRRRRFCFVRHRLNLNENTLLQVISNNSLLLQDVPRHPHARLFEVREALKRTSLLFGFPAYIRANIAFFRLRRPSGGHGAQQTPDHQLLPCEVYIWRSYLDLDIYVYDLHPIADFTYGTEEVRTTYVQ